MDLLDLLILALRLVLVALLYVFLVTVLRLATRGLQVAPAPRPLRDTHVAELRLVVLEAGGSGLTPGQVIEVVDGATLGRAEPSQIRLADSAVSSQHAQLSRVGRGWMVTDLGSTNGTQVNDLPVKREAALRDGDVLGMGNVRLKVATTR
jgi:hypothetical protein